MEIKKLKGDDFLQLIENIPSVIEGMQLSLLEGSNNFNFDQIYIKYY